MTSEPASVISQLQEPDRGEPLEAAKIPLKHKGLDIASQMLSVELAGPELASAVGNYSTSVDRTLSVIEAIEATLQRKRRQIEEIQARQEILALEYRQLGRSLDTATKDLADQFIDIIADLETAQLAAEPLAAKLSADEARETNAPAAAVLETSEISAEPPAEMAPEMSDISAEPPAEMAPETSEISAEPPVEKGFETSDTSAEPPVRKAFETSGTTTESTAAKDPETSEALDLDLELSDLPPVPEFLGGRQDSSEQNEYIASRDAGPGSRPWWKHGKKG